MRKSGWAAAAVAACTLGSVAWGVVSTETGCTIQGTCDATTVYVPSIPPGGAAPYTTGQGFSKGAGLYAGSDGVAWESSPVDGQWMLFSGQETYVIYPQLPDGGPFVGPYVIETQISADPNPGSNPGSNSTAGAGNPVELLTLPDGGNTGFEVFNDTCSTYYLWVRASQEGTLATGGEDAGDAG